MDRMGNVLCSLDSLTDFPPLRNRYSILNQWGEGNNTEDHLEESISSSENERSLSDSSINLDKSFQESLSRERAPTNRTRDILNFITLRRSYLIEVADSRNRQHTLSKKVSDEDSGWWKITGKKVVPENKKSEKKLKICVLELRI